MGNELKAVVFDLDGTLLDTLDDLADATNWALRNNGLPGRTRDEVCRFVGNGVRRLVERAVPPGTEQACVERSLDDFRRYYVDHCEVKTHPYTGIPALLETLRTRGLRLAIVSNKLQAGVTELHRRYFRDTVDVAVGERPGLRRKPAPDMVLAALDELGVAPGEAVYVGDSDVDIATARACGLPCISVAWGFRDREFLLAHGATLLAEEPAEVVRLAGLEETRPETAPAGSEDTSPAAARLAGGRRRVILVTGGQRSGKSTYAERLARSLAPNPVYMATAHVWDEEFRERVRQHRARRGPEWTTIEEERALGRHDVRGRVVLVDCLTLWATNFFTAAGDDTPTDAVLAELRAEVDRLTAQEATFIFVTNEIGLGGTPAHPVQRRFTDLLGWLNQYVASLADEVVLMVSGVPVKIKGDTALSAEVLQHKIDNLNKPKGSLGRLEELALQVGLIQQTLTPELRHPVHLLFGADHGIEREGVSVSPREVTWQQMINFTRGGGGVNLFCRQHGFDLRLVDMGVDHDLSAYPQIRNCKVAPHGTASFLQGPAMTEEQCRQALRVGESLVDEVAAEGCNVVAIGEMGIGNTSASSLWMSILLDLPLARCIGAGAGLNAEGVSHKQRVLAAALDNWRRAGGDASPESVMRHFGGFEMVAAVGAMRAAARRRMVVLVDGFIMTACALMADRLQPDLATGCRVQDFCIFCHCGDESGHRLMLDSMGARPLLHLGLRLGEGTGALCAFPLVDSAVRMLREMGNFEDNQITKYF